MKSIHSRAATLFLILCASFAPLHAFATIDSFVTVKETQFQRNGHPYIFMGVNLWSAMNLGSKGPSGDRDRLGRELDELKALGVQNLRIMASSEGPDDQPWRIVPSLQKSPGTLDRTLLEGLDYALNEMKKRDLTAVLVLGNFWEWSGGFGQYRNWAGSVPASHHPPYLGGSWSDFSTYASQFYADPKAVKLYLDFVASIVSRVSSLTGLPYRDDPTIMSWELANEPRGTNHEQDFGKWIATTSTLIKSLDSHHLVTTGVEGSDINAGIQLVRDHSYKTIDYMTFHVWAQNAGWYDPLQAERTFPTALQKMKIKIDQSVSLAQQIQKPIVLEEFGLARDQNKYAPGTPVTWRDQYYQEVFKQVFEYAKTGKSMSGVNFWAWGGEARPQDSKKDSWWHAGDPFIGDPPHEPQGWYSVFSSDKSTLNVISNYAKRLRAFNH